jgi:3-phenylpropionate/trans-cinnamate dioxygenase ferredoxin reductase subunit
MRRTVAIVGSGPGGITTALELRAGGHVGEIVVYGDEADAPYDRTTLSKELLSGAIPEDEVWLQPLDRYAEQGIDLRLGEPIVGFDPSARTLTSRSGGSRPFDVAVFATGANPRRIPVPGADLPGVHYLRTIADCRSLQDMSSKHVVIIGFGLIGCELASTFRARGPW